MSNILSGAPVSVLQPDPRVAYRSPVNPYDKATIFNFYPSRIYETKITLQPGIFDIPAGSLEKPGRLVIGPSSWWHSFDPEQPLHETPVSAIVVADSVVKDYNNSRLGSNMGDSQPGLFYMPGEISVEVLFKEFATEVKRTLIRQRNWYQQLVKLADALWARTNGNPLAVPDDCRIAATSLGLTRDWAVTYQRSEMVPCTACGSLRNPLFPICGNCKSVVDKDKADALGLIFAK